MISWQGLFSVMGVGVSILLLCSKKYTMEKRLLCFLFELIGIVLGSKILYIILNNRDITLDSSRGVISLIFIGFSFYGGIAGGIFMIWLYCRIFKINFKAMIRELIITFPLIYAFMKIGCLFVGCCYGIPYDGIFSVKCASGITRVPTQLIDSLLHFIIFGILIFVYLKGKDIVILFFVLHGLERFFVEYIRADETKDMAGSLSVNQLISSVIICVCIFYVSYQRLHKQCQKE